MPNVRHTRWIRLSSFVGLALLCIGALVSGTLMGWAKRSPLMTRALLQGAAETVGIKAADPFEGKDHLTLLVLGCDSDLSRGGKKVLKKYARSDMMMVAKLDFVKNRITGLSIPRDTLSRAGKYGEQKINAFHQFGGKELAQEAVQNLLPGVHIDRVVILDFEAFQDMVNTVGGVEVFVAKRMKWTDKAAKLYIDLQPGKQKLDGYDAMCFVRYRHGDSDFMRTDRQRDFLMAFKAAVVADPLHLPEVANKGAAVLNNSLSNDEILTLGKFAQKVGNDNIKMGLLPTVEVEGYNLRVDQSKLEATLQEFHLTDGPTRVSQLP